MTEPAPRSPSADQTALLRRVPSVDELLGRPRIAALCNSLERGFAVEMVREVLRDVRREITSASVVDPRSISPEALEQRILETVRVELEPSLQTVINATGVILHTNLGRAPLPPAVVEEFRRTATHYSNLEFDLFEGVRGRRDVHLSRSLEHLTGAEAAIVVNNCAAAVLVTLAALARGGEVIISRGELIEIGDSFRIPEIMEQSGAVLKEVGTTNRTRLADYEQAISEKTRLLLRVHPSNFLVTGFTEKPEVADLIALARLHGLPVVEDLGSGCLVDLSVFGIQEPTVRQSIEAGFSLVLFSGDKLLGGPQAGIIAGKKDVVARVRRHPLFRALRVDKLTIAAMEVTLRAYLRAAWEELPAQRMIRTSAEELSRRTAALAAALRPMLKSLEAEVEITSGTSLAGGGSTPTQGLPTTLLRIRSQRHTTRELEARLRNATAAMPVVARIEDDRLTLDLRTVFPDQDTPLIESLVTALH